MRKTSSPICRRRSTPPAQRRREQDELRSGAAGRGMPAAAVPHAGCAGEGALELFEIRAAGRLHRGADARSQDLREAEQLLERPPAVVALGQVVSVGGRVAARVEAAGALSEAAQVRPREAL